LAGRQNLKILNLSDRSGRAERRTPHIVLTAGQAAPGQQCVVRPFDKLRAPFFDKLRAPFFDKLRARPFDKLRAPFSNKLRAHERVPARRAARD